MDSNNHYDSNAPNTNLPKNQTAGSYGSGQFSSQIPQPTPERRRFSRKILFLILGILLLLIIVILLLTNKKDTPESISKTSGYNTKTFIHRDGYDKEEGEGAIGDAAALKQVTSDKVINYRGYNIVQPCALITLDDIKSTGGRLYTNTLTGPLVMQTYSGQGLVTEPNKLFIPERDEANSCIYQLAGSKIKTRPYIIHLKVLQGANMSQRAYDSELKKYTQQADVIPDVKLFRQTRANSSNPDEQTYLLRSKTFASKVHLYTQDQATTDKYLKIIAERMAKADSTPTPQTNFTYTSPVIGQVFTDCSLLDDANFNLIVEAPASPIIRQSYASAIGIFLDPKTKKPFNYTSYECRRPIAEGENLPLGYMTMATSTYDSVEDAKMMFSLEQEEKANAKNIQKLQGVGDEAYFGDPAVMLNSFAFRKGRVIIHVGYFNDDKGEPGAARRIQVLTPVMQKFADSIKGF